jgi:transcription factor E
MQTKFLKSIVETLINKQAIPIIDLLVDKKNVNEFLIAKKLKLTINQTRNILYKLSDYGLVSFIRKKDKRKGWYIYFWTLNTYQSLKLLEENMKKELENLESQLKNRKEKRYYVCNTCSIEINEESALLNDFVCPECEEVYTLSDNREIIAELEKNIVRTKKEIELVSGERKIEESKLEKKKVVKIKNAERKAKEVRKKNREFRIKIANKDIKKSKKINKKNKKIKKAIKSTKFRGNAKKKKKI